MKKFLTFFFLLIVTPVIIFCQTDTAKAVATSGGFLSHIPTWVYIALGAAYEVIVRIAPTGSNLSVIGLVIKGIQAILPNKSSDPAKKSND